MARLKNRKVVPIMKPLNLDLDEIATRPSYHTIAKGKYAELDGVASYDRYMEVRQYPPCKRTIEIEGVRYFLQFPSMVFLWTAIKYREGRGRGRDLNLSSFSAYVAKTPIMLEGDLIYQAPLPNVFEEGRVCMPTPRDPTADNVVETFWQSSFRSYDYSTGIPRACLETNFGTLNKWQAMNLAKVESGIKYNAHPIRNLIKSHWTYPYEWFGKHI